MKKIIQVVCILLVISSGGESIRNLVHRRHPIPFYPGLKEPHGQRFLSGPHHQQRRNGFYDGGRPQRVIFPNPAISPKELYYVNENNPFENGFSGHANRNFQRPNRFKNGHRETNEEHGFRFRFPNHRPKFHRRPVFDRPPRRRPSDSQPSIVIYEGSRPPVRSYYRPPVSGYDRFRDDVVRNNEKINENKFVHRSPIVEEAKEITTPVYSDGQEKQTQLPVFATHITNVDVSDNNAGWIPLPSSSKSYFSGVFGNGVQEYKEPVMSYTPKREYTYEKNVYSGINNEVYNGLEDQSYKPPQKFLDFSSSNNYEKNYDNYGLQEVKNSDRYSSEEQKDFSHHSIEKIEKVHHYDPTGHGDKAYEVADSEYEYIYGSDDGFLKRRQDTAEDDDEGYSKKIPENRDVTSGSDEALTVFVGGGNPRGYYLQSRSAN